ncbi:hypothetical protein A2462_04385 [candidate division WOR-1 bacterium RIFOXYC2_FULL_41_25]|uniref:Uncharacterized protein n=1 Tax=candidate division WOR-1 bacterium RIFOXYC2_FULL_41_25 TaxID=1802586 RepID=A0A1F4TPB5_UNCSA|nr:MAG: hypothetical protein A2462_04385 [candidate division WOR-1 bacterium RIFOXYC2_FULL_41_25]
MPLAANNYQIYQTDGLVDTILFNPSHLKSDFVVNLDHYFAGVVISDVSIPGGGDKIEFSPLGAPYNDRNGSVLTAEAVITLQYKGLTKQIRITPNTGKVYIQ